MSWMPALVVAGLATFVTRLSFIALLAHARTPPLLARALRLVPFAVLAAIILPELVLREGAPHLALDNLRLWAGLAAGGVALATRNVFLTIAVGMGALWGLQALVR